MHYYADIKRYIRHAIPVIVCLIAWETMSRSGRIDIAYFPPPSRVIRALGRMIWSWELLWDMEASYVRVAAGLVSGTVVGVVLGLLTGRVKVIADLVSPLIQIFRPLPPVAIIPVVILWFGIGEGAKIFSIGFAAFFPIWLNTHLGAQQIPQKLLWSASTLTKSRRRIFWRIIFPASLPFIVAGIRMGIAVAFVMVFVSELAGASQGIGYRISVTNQGYSMDKMFAALAVLGASGALADYLFAKAVQWKFAWLKYSQIK